MKIYLSPSSQWENPYTGTHESEALVCGVIAEYTKVALERNGYEVKLGSNQATFQARVKESNQWGADVHHCIHTNAGGGQGTLVLCYPGCANDKYVKNVYNAVAELTPTKDQGIRENGGLYEINESAGMCVYIEVDFHDNADIAKWLVRNIENIAEATAKGYCKADGKAYKGKVPTPHTPDTNTNTNTKGLYRVQVGAYKEIKNAESMVKKLKSLGIDSFIKQE